MQSVIWWKPNLQKTVWHIRWYHHCTNRECSVEKNIWFMYRAKISGPNIDPCGTPVSTVYKQNHQNQRKSIKGLGQIYKECSTVLFFHELVKRYFILASLELQPHFLLWTGVLEFHSREAMWSRNKLWWWSPKMQMTSSFNYNYIHHLLLKNRHSSHGYLTNMS